MINRKKLYLSFVVFLFLIGGIGFLYNIIFLIHDTLEISKLSPACVNAIHKLRDLKGYKPNIFYRFDDPEAEPQPIPINQWLLLESTEKQAIIEEILKEKYSKQFENYSPEAYLQKMHIREYALSKYNSLFWSGDPSGKSIFILVSVQFLWFVPAILLMLSKRWFDWVKK